MACSLILYRRRMPQNSSLPNSMSERARITPRGVERQNQIRAAAAALFLAKGYDGVTIDEVAKAAKGSKSAVYENFSDKNGLFASALDFIAHDIMSIEIPEPKYASDRLKAIVETGNNIVRIYISEKYIQAYRLLYGDCLQSKSSLQKAIVSIQDKFILQISKILDEKSDGSGSIARIIHDSISFLPLQSALTGRQFTHSEIESHINSTAAAILTNSSTSI